MSNYDLTKPMISTVSKGLKGKSLLFYGGNNLGKTSQAVQMEKPLYLMFERGINAIAGVPYFPMLSWSDFVRLNRNLTKPKDIEKNLQMYQTIIIDTVYASASKCMNSITEKHEVDTLGDKIIDPRTGKETGKNLYQLYENTYFKEINKLLVAGFTVVFIGHTEIDRETKQNYPKGDKRSIKPIIDTVDLVVYLESNGTDDEGRPINSSAYFFENSNHFARSRFAYITPKLEEFSIANLEKAVADAITEEEKVKGIKTVEFTVPVTTKKELEFEEVKAEIIKYGKALNTIGLARKVTEAINEYVEAGLKVSEFEPRHRDSLLIVLDELKDIAEENELEIEE